MMPTPSARTDPMFRWLRLLALVTLGTLLLDAPAFAEKISLTLPDGRAIQVDVPAPGQSTRAATRTVSQQDAYVKASNTGVNGYFGYALSLSNDGNTLAVGVAYEDSNATGIGGNQADNSATDSGAVYVLGQADAGGGGGGPSDPAVGLMINGQSGAGGSIALQNPVTLDLDVHGAGPYEVYFMYWIPGTRGKEGGASGQWFYMDAQLNAHPVPADLTQVTPLVPSGANRPESIRVLSVLHVPPGTYGIQWGLDYQMEGHLSLTGEGTLHGPFYFSWVTVR